MSEVRTWKCDASGCPHVRKESNNWWTLKRVYVGPAVRLSIPSPNNNGFLLAPFDNETVGQTDFQFCGLACALRKVSELVGPETRTVHQEAR